jgi:hypothetical protein
MLPKDVEALIAAGVGAGTGASSSSLESTKRLRNEGRTSSSSLESANLLAIVGAALAFSRGLDFLKPGNRSADFVSSGTGERNVGPLDTLENPRLFRMVRPKATGGATAGGLP